MDELRLAVLSDIHGNRWALEAVLKDMEARSIDRVVNLGDSLYGPLDPAGTAVILLSLGAVTVAGNEDRLIVANMEQEPRNPTLAYVRRQLDDKILQWLRALPLTATVDDWFFLCHGTPGSDVTYLIERVTEAGVELKTAAELDREIDGTGAGIILCGHSHLPNVIYTPSGKLIVNPGSVGCPAYDDDIPLPHRMETGHPHARYCLLNLSPEGCRVEQVSMPYDWEEAARWAERNNRTDWAGWLRSGRA